MKRIFFLLIAAGSTLTALAQAPDDNSQMAGKTSPKTYTKDGDLLRWVFDINLLGGGLTQDLTTINSLNNYTNVISSVSNAGELKFKKGMSYGFDAQFGFFFGKKRHFGLGTGFMYLEQRGDLVLDKFHVEYQASDRNGQIYRQLISSNAEFKESLNITNLNIPVVLKYKNRFSKRWGFTADLGALINLQMNNRYESNASFDYEAIYHPVSDGNGGYTSVYDNNPTPLTTSVLYTKAQYMGLHNNDAAYVNNYFNNTLRPQGLNVGLGVKPDNNSGTVSYKTGSVGLLAQPSINYFFNDHIALNVGAYFIYQPFKNETNSTYRVTNSVGGYSSVANSVSEGTSMSYGGNLGLRVFFGKHKDRDKDGVPDKDDKCPDVPGPVRLEGCPDRDGDGIVDIEDQCPDKAGLLQFHGCPDSDGDGIPDKDDACPFQAGPERYKGCPDKDGDGILDKDDACPDKAGPAQFHGCPDTDGDGVPDNEDRCPNEAGPADNNGCPVAAPPAPQVEPIKVSTPILFELNKTVIQATSYPVLEEAVRKLNDDKDAIIIVDGYTDITGKVAYNRKLSLRRAAAVKAELKKMGINPKRVKVVGHGSESPAADNDTPEGRMRNRRAVMHLNVGN